MKFTHYQDTKTMPKAVSSWFKDRTMALQTALQAVALPACLVASSLALGTAAQANVSINVDWNVNKGTVKSTQIGLGVWAGMNPAVASIQNYKNGIGFIGAPLTRYHAAEQVYAGGERSWVDSNGNWVASRAQSVFDSTNYGQDKLVNIANWPPNMDTNNDGKLDSDKFAQYADWCKQLVVIMNGSGRYVKYWEPLNEEDGNYQGDAATLATIFKMARAKMREADSSIQVGGGVFSNPWGDSLIDGFLDGVGTEIDFFSYHHYGSGSSGGSDSDMYNNAESLQYRASGLRNKLVVRGLNIPMLNGEHNMYDTYDKDSNGYMRSAKSAVWDALFFKGMAEGSDADMLASFNDADYTYGKLDPSNNNFTPRPSAYFMKLSRENLVGNIAQTTSSDNASVQGFAVYNGTKHTLALINRTGYAQYVNTGFAGWSPSSTGYTEHRISADEANGYGSSARSWSGAPQNLYMPPHSVYLLQFTSGSRAGGQQPFGGVARSLPGRIQAEDYDSGGKFVAYYDDSIGNAGNVYRSDHVDIYPTTDAGGGYRIGNTSSKEFWRYTVNIPAGTYSVKLRASSYWGTGDNGITVKLEGTTLGSVGVNQTWNDDGFTDAVIANVNVPSNLAGNGKVLEIFSNSGGFNLNWIEFTATSISSVLADGTYRMVNKNSGKALMVSGGSTANAANIVQATYSGVNSQKWTFASLGGGYYSIQNVNSGQFMDIYGASTADGAANIQWPWNNGWNQYWLVESTGPGEYKITNRNSGKLLDISGGATWDGAQNIQWPSNNGWNQRWFISAP